MSHRPLQEDALDEDVSCFLRIVSILSLVLGCHEVSILKKI